MISMQHAPLNMDILFHEREHQKKNVGIEKWVPFQCNLRKLLRATSRHTWPTGKIQQWS